MDTTGSRIRRLRKDLSLTQKELGRRIGVSPATVTLWEKDETLPRGDNSVRLVEVLSTSWGFLRTGVESDNIIAQNIQTGKRTFLRANSASNVPLFNRQNLALHLKGKSATPIKMESSIEMPDDLISRRVVAMVEDMAGLSPMIMIGDRVFIKPELPIKIGSNSVFWVDGNPIAGMVDKTPTGLFLRFLAKGPGWEPIQVNKDNDDDYIGRIIACDPKWAIEGRED